MQICPTRTFSRLLLYHQILVLVHSYFAVAKKSQLDEWNAVHVQALRGRPDEEHASVCMLPFFCSINSRAGKHSLLSFLPPLLPCGTSADAALYTRTEIVASGKNSIQTKRHIAADVPLCRRLRVVLLQALLYPIDRERHSHSVENEVQKNASTAMLQHAISTHKFLPPCLFSLASNCRVVVLTRARKTLRTCSTEWMERANSRERTHATKYRYTIAPYKTCIVHAQMQTRLFSRALSRTGSRDVQIAQRERRLPLQKSTMQASTRHMACAATHKDCASTDAFGVA